ncbi:hypothetical protein [Alistipes putredinis]|uniref:hypothetical protein n=1 Tax=Alistipes putredinis TaxID=28117 RepID=UPI003AB46339
MRSKTFQTVIPHRMNERLVMVAINTNGTFTEEQRMQLRHIAWKRIGGRNISTHSVYHYSEACRRGETFAIFENHVVEIATLRERIKFRLRKFFAAAMAYVGINTVLVVVVNDTNPLMVDGATFPVQALD